MTFVLVPQPTLDNKHRRSCLTSGRSVSGWRLVTHGARALQPNGFRFRLILREVPGLSANPLGFRGGGGTAVQDRETEASPPKHRPAESSRWLCATGPWPGRKIHATSAAVDCTCVSVLSSSFPSLRGVFGHCLNPRPRLRSRLRSRLRPRLRSRLRSRRRTCGRTKGGLCCRSAVPNAQQL